jgi:hypothetical protein
MLHGTLLPVRHVVNTIPACTSRRLPDFSNVFRVRECCTVHAYCTLFHANLNTICQGSLLGHMKVLLPNMYVLSGMLWLVGLFS